MNAEVRAETLPVTSSNGPVQSVDFRKLKAFWTWLRALPRRRLG
ncbi:MAG: hypothetical protein QM755_20770 [Luteolibacter sp.]